MPSKPPAPADGPPTPGTGQAESQAATPKTRGTRAPVPKPARPSVDSARIVGDAILIALFLGLTFLLGVFPVKDTDFWWHLRTGDLIRQTGTVPRTDWYTFGAEGRPWIDIHWLFEVLISHGYELGGIVFLNLAKCAITCLAVGLLVGTRRRDWPVWVMIVAWLPALFVLSGRMYPRPETLTLLWLSIDLAILARWERYSWRAWLLPVVQILWVNTQGLFVLGPIVLGFAVIDALLAPGTFAPKRRKWWRNTTIICVLTLVACLVGPYHIRGALFPVELARTMGNPIFAGFIAELKPVPAFIEEMGIWNLPLLLHLAAMTIGALSFLVPLLWSVFRRLIPRRNLMLEVIVPGKQPRKAQKAATGESTWRLSPFRLLLFLAFSLISLRATRNTHQFAAVVGAVTAWNFGEWAASLRRGAPRPLRPAESLAQVPYWIGTAGLLLALLAFVGSGTFFRLAGEGRVIGLGEEPRWFPHEAVRSAAGPGMPERFVCFHNGLCGLYEYYAGPARKNYADARLEVIGPELFASYVGLEQSLRSNFQRRDEIESFLQRAGKDFPLRDRLVVWPEALERMGKPGVLVDLIQTSNAELAATLLAQPGWACTWFDALTAVFVPNSYPAARRPVSFWHRHFLDQQREVADQSPEDALAAAKALADVAFILVQRGRPDLARPLIALGLDHGRRAREQSPHVVGGWKVMGQLHSTREPVEAPRFRMPFDPVFDLEPMRATFMLRQAVRIAPEDTKSLFMLAMNYQLREMYESSLPLYRKLATTDPPTMLRMRASQLRQEAIAAAAVCLAALGPEPKQERRNLDELDRSLRANLATGRAESAVRLLEAAYPAPARSWEVADRMATLWLHLGYPEKARAAWRDASQPSRPALVAARIAVTYLIEDDFDTARQYYREALLSEASLFEAHFGIALLEFDLGRAEPAYPAAHRAREFAANDVERDAAQLLLDVARPFVSESIVTQPDPLPLFTPNPVPIR